MYCSLQMPPSFINLKTFSIENYLTRMKTVCTYSTFLIVILLALSCNQAGNFEKSVQIKNHEWSNTYIPEIEFKAVDTLSSQNVYIVLRHTHSYAYSNLWLNISTLQPGDSVYQKDRFELILQQPDGQWIGKGLNDVWEIRYPLFSNIRFTKKGIYRIRVQQAMRDEPLLHIMNIGIRIEKATS